jgi:hypothetical protein
MAEKTRQTAPPHGQSAMAGQFLDSLNDAA